jgi:hypothetical protein
MLTKPTIAFVAALVLVPASTAFAQSQRQTAYTRQQQTGYPQSRTGRSVPALTRPRNAGEAALDCNTTYKGFRMCDWLRPDHSPY